MEDNLLTTIVDPPSPFASPEVLKNYSKTLARLPPGPYRDQLLKEFHEFPKIRQEVMAIERKRGLSQKP